MIFHQSKMQLLLQTMKVINNRQVFLVYHKLNRKSH